MQFNIDNLLSQMAKDLASYLSNRSIENPLMVGIHTGGVWVANHLHARLKAQEPLGMLDISFYRDDFSRIGVNPKVKPSSLPPDIDGRHIVLVDDVLYTGRTTRAALNELFDYGRPASVILVVLIERNGRELPIYADIVGKRLELKGKENVKLAGPEPLKLNILVKKENKVEQSAA